MVSRTFDSSSWLSRQRIAFESLVGCVVTAWEGVEMAFREETPDGPQFADPGVPFLQLLRLDLMAGPGEQHTIDTYQDDADFGLCIAAGRAPAGCGWDGIFRQRALDLPTGAIDAVEVKFEEDTLAEVILTIGEDDLLLIAGEVHERPSGTLEVHRFDESVLAFTNPADAESVSWVPARHG